MTRQQAIDAKCKECIFDPLDEGTWRQQVKACDMESCALHPYRPMPYKPRRQSVQRDSDGMCLPLGGNIGVKVSP
jgi:hypothetical protein